MTEQELDRAAEQETSWLRHYGHKDTRTTDSYEDEKFYDRINSIGYAKVDTPLDRRCPATYITSDIPVLQSNVGQLKNTSGPRNHEQNVYTPLEYVVSQKIGRYAEFINVLKS
jgi:hypothetical protein